MEDEKESLKDSSILKEEHADMQEVSPQPMHVIAAIMEDINDEDDLLDDFDAFFSFIKVDSFSLVYEDHVHQQ